MIEGGPALSRLVCMFRSQIWFFSLFSFAICSFPLEHHSDFKQRHFIFFVATRLCQFRVVRSDDTVWCDTRAEFSRFASHFQCQIHRFKCETNPTGRGAQPSWYTGKMLQSCSLVFRRFICVALSCLTPMLEYPFAFRRERDSAFNCRHMFALSLLDDVCGRGWGLAAVVNRGTPPSLLYFGCHGKMSPFG